MMWPGHVDDFDMEASRMANMLHAHVPLAMSLCHVDYAKMQSSLSNHMYAPGAFEGILELRKEKSRDAARSRRGKENYEFYELAKLLPLPAAITSQLDKASIIRLTISYLKLRDFSSHGDPPWTRDGPTPSKTVKAGSQQCRSSMNLAQDVFESHQGTHILQSLDGFAFALSNDARFLYISETVSIYLGLSQVEMAGSSIFEYIHSHDHKELAEQLGLNAPKASSFPSPTSGTSDEGSSTPNPTRSTTPTMSERVSIMSPNPSKGYDRCFCIRMKSTLTKRGVHFKSSGYRVVQIVAHLRPQYSFPVAQKQLPPLLGLVGMAIALPPPTITELIIDNDMFITRLSPQLKITYCEPRIADMMDITSEDLVNKNLYDFCHAEDLQKLNKAHSDLLSKGQVLTDYYRLMNRHGGFVWIQTCATIICNAKNVDEQNIIAINYVLSGVEYAGCVMNIDQYRAVTKSEIDPLDHPDHPIIDKDYRRDREKPVPPQIRLPDETRFAPHDGFKQSTMYCHDMAPTGVDFDCLQSPHDNRESICSPENEMSNRQMELLKENRTGSAKTMSKSNLKNSRRKMEKPRKRKRVPESGIDPKISKLSTAVPDKAGMVSQPVPPGNVDQRQEETGTNSKRFSEQKEPTSGITNGLAARDNNSEALTRSSSPEDLSAVRPGSSSPTPGDRDSPSQPGPTNAIHDAWLSTVSGACSSSASDGYPDNHRIVETTSSVTSSVHDLEAAMNKHLPAAPSSNMDTFESGFGHPILGLPKHKSTIQWIGGTNPHAAADLSASTLLRSLYPGRESVIRTNMYSSSRGPQYYSDIQNALLTPPGGAADVYKDSFSAAASLLGHSKAAAASNGAYGIVCVNGYSSSPLGINMTSTADAYAVTPPSSVSPQESYMSQFLDHLHADSAALMQPYCTGASGAGGGGGGGGGGGTSRGLDGSLGMPIKPHAYSLPVVHGSNSYDPYHGGYYASNVGMATYNHYMGGNAAHYLDSMKNTNSW